MEEEINLDIEHSICTDIESIEDIIDSKCGEVYVENINKNGYFFITCNYCNNSYKHFDIFQEHVLNDHLGTEPDTPITDSFMPNFKIEDITNNIQNESKIDEEVHKNEEEELLLNTYLTNGSIEIVEEYVPQYNVEGIHCGSETSVMFSEENKINLISENNFNTQGSRSGYDYSVPFNLTENDFFEEFIEEDGLSGTDFGRGSTLTLSSTSFNQITNISSKLCEIHADQKYHCPFPNCDAIYLNKIDLKCHFQIHSNFEKKHKCAICTISYKFEDSYKKHMKGHTGEYLNKPIGSLYKRKRNRCKKVEPTEQPKQVTSTITKPPTIKDEQNSSQISSDNNLNYTCKSCGKIYKILKAFIEHEKIHTGEKQLHSYKCEHCDKIFGRIDYYKNHLNTHTGDRPYRCQYCGWGFAQPGNLKTHVLSHLGKKQYKCEFCEKRFVQSSSKKIHERNTHTKELPFDCDICGQKLVSQHKLNFHKKSKHSTERPFKCNECDKGFLTRADLKCHTVSHTNEKPFECTICHKRFPRQKALRSHEKLHFEQYPGLAAQKAQRLPRRILKLVVPPEDAML